ncbi:hypothetical protein F2Q68_00021153 [Brassica cretica]|uniref:Uncharacterized protein n=1 Tax=Brassica cretica TaxID=69181 RepID=A0A8S9FUE1_BRACR|nr:hypothetical protein F2Q68_00021153 [Brassica cretica]
MEEMKQDIAKIQTQRAAEATTQASIERKLSTSIDDEPSHSNPMKSQPVSYTRAEIDQFVEEIYRTLGTTEERLDRRCDDIYFPMDLTISSLTSQIEAMQREIVEVQRYIARRPEESPSIDRRIHILTDSHIRTSIDEATQTNQGRLVPKVTSNMSDTNNHGEEISADSYATLVRHQIKIESLGDRLQKIENTTSTMKDKWRRGDEAMRDFIADLQPKGAQFFLSWGLVYMRSDSSNKSGRVSTTTLSIPNKGRPPETPGPGTSIRITPTASSTRPKSTPEGSTKSDSESLALATAPDSDAIPESVALPAENPTHETAASLIKASTAE